MDSNTHRIRLRAAWHRQIGTSYDRVDLPDIQPALCDSPLHYWRSFNCPTGLTEQSLVVLRVEAWLGLLSIRLDETLLAEGLSPQTAPWEMDITTLIKSAHRLQLDLKPNLPMGLDIESAEQMQVGLAGIVILQIVDSAS